MHDHAHPVSPDHPAAPVTPPAGVRPASSTARRPSATAPIACCGCRPAPEPKAKADHPDHAGHEHGHGEHGDHAEHDHDHSALPGRWRLGAALALAAAAEGLHLLAGESSPIAQYGGMALAAVAIGLAGVGIYASGWKSLLRGQLGIDALMAVAVTGAFLLGQWPEAAMVMALYALAERIEEAAATRARNAVGSLLALRPENAEVRDAAGTWTKQPLDAVTLGATVRIGPGGRIPFDGTVTEGRGAVDEASISGESLPVDKAPGDTLFAGTLNAESSLEFRVDSVDGQTTLDRTIRSVEEAQSALAPTQRLVDRFAKVYTPIVFGLAVLLAVGAPLVLGWAWRDAVYRALVLLVIACPCALVLSTPVTVVSALAAAARRGILIKGGVWLEQARLLRLVAFDKTGTLTQGKPVLVEHRLTRADQDAGSALADAAALAMRSDHPVSKALVAGLPDEVRDAAPVVDDFRALSGRGVAGRIAGRSMLLGNRRLMTEQGFWTEAVEAMVAPHEQAGRSVTLLADGQAVRAVFAVADTLRPSAREAVEALARLGIGSAMLTGDHPAAAQAIAREAGITQVRAGLLPDEKLAAIAELQGLHGQVAMAGDGINDAPALARADIGVAIGAAGTDVAVETAGIVILHDDLRRVAEVVRLSRRTRTVLLQNIAIALGLKLVFLVLAIAGLATMWMAVFADVGASLLVIANGLRMLRLGSSGGGARAHG
ncbi:heavy metal translocating P-type ATPase [Xylophilus sp. GOD-11R]|uniref:heavy metal translocating P-type ATPase n=1 Tax=Xylophilus sp. GOD-11R TaxID=3089814 RepID=UPI00298C6A1B|nr:heavy metal translocating P-type ATPase [Xylophilus sp. GOD-11R]WPB59281.1 heavy metal translocating P-type ATPase [Xylophilus sp. GOD-11R]